MSRIKGLLAVAVLVLIATPLAGQERAFVVEFMGGGYSHVNNLNTTGPDAHFKVGYTIGTALGVNINEYFGIRGDATLARSEGKGAVNFANQMVNRYFLGGHLEGRYPFRQITPFLYAGGGAVIVDQQGQEVDEDFDHFTRGAGVFGAGLEFNIPNAPIDITAQGRATTYKWVAAPYSRVLWEVGYMVGFSYQFGF